MFGTNPQPYIDGCLVYYKNGNLTDVSGNGNNGTLSGSYIQTDDHIEFTGGYGVTGNINNNIGTYELYCSINSDFVPRGVVSNWYNLSCLFGCELPNVQKDFALVINWEKYLVIGYARNSASVTSFNCVDGKLHHLALIVEANNIKLYVDGVLIDTINYTMSGDVPTNYGLFWNNNDKYTNVKGSLYLFRYFPKSLTLKQIQNNYNLCKIGIY